MRHLRFPTCSIALLIGALFFAGCAGPNTPLGAVSWLSPRAAIDAQALAEEAAERAAQDVRSEATAYAPKLSFSPDRQVLHESAPMIVTIRDPFGSVEDYELAVLYDGLDVSGNFLRSAIVHEDLERNEIRVRVPKVRLDSKRDHRIEVTYRSRSGSAVHARYEPPNCHAFRAEEVVHTGRFQPPRRLMSAIRNHSLRAGFNPAFLTGLIAQESGFDPRAVSWARAVGLTQVTPIAAKELVREFPKWPRSPRLNRLPPLAARAMILSGKLKPANDWRLDPEKSVIGGLAYARILAERWSTPASLAYLRATFRDPETEHTRLVLASYHSGYSRVHSALRRRGEGWLRSPSLKEARKYVNRISSYCHHFAEEPLP
ncbi:MAG: transglycosylase SLT domain-containing protein [Bdellovibrionales bacterium]|nr:transglycosylase SLT domain-containing protein [Bdellovibrionales bacterium]